MNARCFRCGSSPEAKDTYYELNGEALCAACWAQRPLPPSSVGERRGLIELAIEWLCDRSWARFR